MGRGVTDVAFRNQCVVAGIAGDVRGEVVEH